MLGELEPLPFYKKSTHTILWVEITFYGLSSQISAGSLEEVNGFPFRAFGYCLVPIPLLMFLFVLAW